MYTDQLIRMLEAFPAMYEGGDDTVRCIIMLKYSSEIFHKQTPKYVKCSTRELDMDNYTWLRRENTIIIIIIQR